MKRFLPVILILLLFSAGCAPKSKEEPAGTTTPPSGSMSAMASQLNSALSSGNPVVMEFYSDG
ncbi:MAG: hypothetical protein M1536_04220 [Firmicutes bacterium]|nr:hypothetical protein [Bacillota bacterium]